MCPEYIYMSREGAYAPNHVYTNDDIKNLVHYAMQRGIRIIPELDTPGHVYRGWESSGLLTQCYNPDGSVGDWGPLNPTLNKTYEVVVNLYTEIYKLFAPEKLVMAGTQGIFFLCVFGFPKTQNTAPRNSKQHLLARNV